LEAVRKRRGKETVQEAVEKASGEYIGKRC